MPEPPPEQLTTRQHAPSRWRLKGREKRLIVYLLILGAFAAWRLIPRPWHPAITFEAPNHFIYSSATQQQVEEAAHALGLLYEAYSNHLGSLPGFSLSHPKLKVKLFKDRAEFRRINRNVGWAEAFYRKPYCHAYYSSTEPNPYHWMLHEAVHQLNREVADLKLAKWLEEGLAEYFSTSRVESNHLAVGLVDLNTYPVWWIDELATSPDITENLANKSVIPLRSIITNHGGPSLNSNFNLYYLHWWTLTHFIFQSPRYHEHALLLLQRGGSLEAFEKTIGPVDQIQEEWHAYVRNLKAELSGVNLKAAKSKPSLRLSTQ